MKSLNEVRKSIITQSDLTKESIRDSFIYNLACTLAKDEYTATKKDNFMSLAITIRDRMIKRWIATQQAYHKENKKRVYYLSMEFLIGRLLGNNIINVGIEDEVLAAMQELGFNLEELREQEFDAGLGNGGLGRLAACYLDSMATLGIPAHGYGIRYEYGIFNQKIKNGKQVEFPDEWLKFGNPWEFERPEYATTIQFSGEVVEETDKDGRLVKKWINTKDILAVPYDTPVSGYHNDVVNTLRLWSAKSTEEFEFDYFNHGDYERAVQDKMMSENISKVLYPNDNISQGKELRLKQEYFFVAASIADIIRRFKADNADIKKLHEKVAIQLNDTHPALAIPELMRVLIDNEKIDWQRAWDITVKTFAYTNHTIMPEALERWHVELLERLLPRHIQIIYKINEYFLKNVQEKYPGNINKMKSMSIIEEGQEKNIRMANLCIISSHSVNGVSELHTKLLKTRVFKDFTEMFPGKFKNITNGITQRRWLLKSNSNLAGLITSIAGEGWPVDLFKMQKLMDFSNDASFQEKWRNIKQENKIFFADYIKNTTGVLINPASLFDVHIKRIHEYKRQLLFAFYMISQYLIIKNNKDKDFQPRTFLVAGKAAPGYFMAKQIIKFINNIAMVINQDKDIKDKVKVVFLENYRVSLAEKIFPASDLSEQISMAGTEASGTGCMKFMINGALTIGTLDGANIEMADCVGKDNIFTFGLTADEISEIKKKGYNPKDYIKSSAILSEILNMIENDFFSKNEQGIFKCIVDSIIQSDPFFICADFQDYLNKQDEVSNIYKDTNQWTKKSIINVANSGKFSSDRSIAEYAKNIWNVPVYAQ